MLKGRRRKIIFIFLLLLIIGVGLNTKRIKRIYQQTSNKIEQFFSNQGKTVIQNSILEEESAITQVVKDVSPSVVSVIYKSTGFDIFSGSYSLEEGIGTGFIVDPTGIIVTNSHVVSYENGEYEIVTNDGESYEVQEISRDSTSDIAILEINARGLSTVKLGDSDKLQVGQTAIAIGNALGQYSNTVTTGVVSGVARSITASAGFGGPSKTYQDVIQTDAALNPGNSGGPLLNSAGQVIGINVATTKGADNIGFAIPVNTLKPILESYIKEGRIVKPFLGVTYSIITEDISKLREFPEGAYVSGIVGDSSAEEAGLQRGDIITKIDGEEINSKNLLSNVITKYKVGNIIKIEVDRDGEILELLATLREAPQN